MVECRPTDKKVYRFTKYYHYNIDEQNSIRDILKNNVGYKMHEAMRLETTQNCNSEPSTLSSDNQERRQQPKAVYDLQDKRIHGDKMQ